MFVIWVSLGNWRYLNTERLELSSHVLRAVLAVGQNEEPRGQSGLQSGDDSWPMFPLKRSIASLLLFSSTRKY